MSTAKKLLSGLEAKYKKASLLSPLMMVGEVAMEVYIPSIMANIINIGIASHDADYVIKYGLFMILCAFVSLTFGILGARFAAVGALGFARNLRRRLFNKVQDFSFTNVDKFSTASLVTRLTTDVTNTQNTYQMILRMCIRSPIMLIAATIMSVKMNASLSMLFVAAIPLLAVPLLIIMKMAFPRFQIMMKKYDALNSSVQENLTGIRAVKAFVRENHESEKFRNAADAVRKAQINAEKLVIINMPLMQFVMYLCMVGIFWFGGKLVIFGSMQVGDLISFSTYLMQILGSLMAFSMILVVLVISRASINRIIEVLDEDITVKNPEKNAVTEVGSGKINFKNVYYSYDGELKNAVLDNVSLEIKSGQTVGIIGGTGSSKSTLVQLIARLYDATKGCVLIDDVDVKDYDIHALRDSVAMVLQKNVLFSGTIKQNLLWGNENATDEEIFEAAKASCAHDFIMSFPDGYDTELGQGGVNLSGGQKQRLCIARALLKKPKILILDDSTSAVDTATDSYIRKALKTSLSDSTKIIIAQRIASVCEADVIFVMDEGKITDSGTHESLLKTSSIYREVYSSQQSGAEALKEGGI